jgi:tetratricopeptide (TPR) repeat protein
MNMSSVLTLEERLELAREKSGEALDSQVLELLPPYLRARPDDGAAWLLLGNALRAVGRYAEAADALKKALALASDGARSGIWCALGMLYQVSHSAAEARAWFDLATRGDVCKDAWVLRGENHLRLQEYPEAIRCFSHGTTLTSEQYDRAVLNLAHAYRATQDYRKALRCAQQVLRRFPESKAAEHLIRELAPLIEEPAAAVQ